MKQNYRRYQRTANEKLSDVYGRYSSEKEKAYNYCKELQYKYNGERFRILSSNTCIFTVGFTGYIDGIKHFFYITPTYDRAMPLETVNPLTGEVTEIAL